MQKQSILSFRSEDLLDSGSIRGQKSHFHSISISMIMNILISILISYFISHDAHLSVQSVLGPVIKQASMLRQQGTGSIVACLQGVYWWLRGIGDHVGGMRESLQHYQLLPKESFPFLLRLLQSGVMSLATCSPVSDCSHHCSGMDSPL